MNLVKDDLLGIHKDRMKIGASLADVDPMQIDRTVRDVQSSLINRDMTVNITVLTYI